MLNTNYPKASSVDVTNKFLCFLCYIHCHRRPSSFVTRAHPLDLHCLNVSTNYCFIICYLKCLTQRVSAFNTSLGALGVFKPCNRYSQYVFTRIRRKSIVQRVIETINICCHTPTSPSLIISRIVLFCHHVLTLKYLKTKNNTHKNSNSICVVC